MNYIRECADELGLVMRTKDGTPILKLSVGQFS
jgi:hypothetical protein